jgi:lipoate---protein ligase
MYCIANSNTDPYFNLAAEEYLLRNFPFDCFMLWRNENAIVVGKHQNTLAEINMDYIRMKGISVVRRLSGGGTVYHDMGNLNYTFIMDGKEGHLVDFRKYTRPILEVLGKLSVDAKFEGRNDLTIGGRKFSGNAEHIYKKRVLHHGTLLFSSVMEDLQLALKVNPMKYKSKAVKSIPSRVTNIKEHLTVPIDVMHFHDMIMEHIKHLFPGSRDYTFTSEDLAKINILKNEKYLTWEWNFGYSPKYDFEKSFVIGGRNIRVQLIVSDGIIKKVKIECDSCNKSGISEVEELMVGIKHNETALKEKFSSITLTDYLHNINSDEFLRGLF